MVSRYRSSLIVKDMKGLWAVDLLAEYWACNDVMTTIATGVGMHVSTHISISRR